MPNTPKKTTLRQYEERARILIDRIRQGATPFSDRSFAAVQERRERGKNDVLWFLQTYVPHWFTAPDGSLTPFAGFHERMIHELQELYRLFVLAGFRESGKSTIARGFALHQGVYGARKFIPYISYSAENSINILQPIKLEYEYNERLRSDFGEMKGKSDWAMDKFVTRSGTCYQAFGRDDVIRSANYNGNRPDLVIMDDMEDPKKSMNIKQVEKYQQWIESDVLFSVNSPKWSAVFIGNWVQNPSIIHSLMTGEHTDHYGKMTIRALDNEDESTWSARHTTEKLLKERRQNPSTFATERMQFPRDAKNKIFKAEWFRHTGERFPKPGHKIAVVWDPATGVRQDFHAILVVGISPEMKFTVYNAWIRNDESKWTAIRQWFRFAKTYDADYMEVEGNAFQLTIREDYDKYIMETQEVPPGKLVIEASKENKDKRISRLEGPIENGLIEFTSGAGDMNTLEYQLENYPNTHDDGPDALAKAYDRLKNAFSDTAEYTGIERRAVRFKEGAW